MVSEENIKQLVERVLSEVKTNGELEDDIETIVEEKVEEEATNQETIANNEIEEENMISDITDINLKEKVYLDNPTDLDSLKQMKQTTSARIGIGGAGARYKTETLIRFRADHAAAVDAVFTTVSDELLDELDLFTISTLCEDKDEYLTRPDLGKKISKESIKTIKDRCTLNPQVQIIVADGLSSTAIEANIKDVLPPIIKGLKSEGINVGTPFFVKYARVASMEPISEALNAEVICVLIGERPGLVTAESMAAYMAYQAKVGMEESKRTVISNIHRGGTPPAEAGAHIVSIIKQMLKEKTSGLDLET